MTGPLSVVATAMRELLRAGHLDPDERAVIQAQTDYLRRHPGDAPAGLLREFARIESRAARRKAELLALPQEPESRDPEEFRGPNVQPCPDCGFSECSRFYLKHPELKKTERARHRTHLTHSLVVGEDAEREAQRAS